MIIKKLYEFVNQTTEIEVGQLFAQDRKGVTYLYEVETIGETCDVKFLGEIKRGKFKPSDHNNIGQIRRDILLHSHRTLTPDEKALISQDVKLFESYRLKPRKVERMTDDLIIENKITDLVSKFNMVDIKRLLKEKMGIDETSTKMEVAKKLMKFWWKLELKLLKYELGAVLGAFVFYFLSIILDVAGVEPFITDGPDNVPTTPHFILWGAGALLNVIRMIKKDIKLFESMDESIVSRLDRELDFHDSKVSTESKAWASS